MRNFLQCLVLFFITVSLSAQSNLQITYVDPIADEVTVTNLGNSSVGGASFWVTTTNQAVSVGDSSFILGPGDHVTVNVTLDNTADFVVFTIFNPAPTGEGQTFSFMQYGAPNQANANDAVLFGLWDDINSFVDVNPNFVTDTGGSAASWLSCSDAGVQASNLQFPDFEIEKDVCISSTSPILVELDIVGTPVGTTQKYLAVDTATFEILSIQDLTASNEFDVQGLESPSVWIYQISYISSVSGLREGDFLFDLEGCYDLSTSVTINRDVVSSMAAFFDNGADTIVYCANGLNSTNEAVGVDFMFGDNIGDLETWVLVNEETDLIIATPEGPPFLFDNLDFISAELHYLRHNSSLTGVAVGESFNDIVGCYAEGFNDLIFERNVLESGILSELNAVDGVISACTINNIVFFEFELEDNSSDFDQQFISVDQATNIVTGVYNSGPDFGLTISELPETTAMYSMTYQSPLSLNEVLNTNINEINGCYVLSNPLLVVKNNVQAGSISYDDTSTNWIVACNGGEFPETLNISVSDDLEGDENIWVLLDANTDQILETTSELSFNLNSYPSIDFFEIVYVATNGEIQGVESGSTLEDITGCFEVSNVLGAFKQSEDPASLVITDTGETEDIICVEDNDAPPVELDFFLEAGPGFLGNVIVVNNENGQILSENNELSVDVNNFEAATIAIYLVRFGLDFEGITIGQNIDDLQGCYVLSNPIIITRATGEDCALAVNDISFEEQITISPKVTDDIVKVMSIAQEEQLYLTAYNLLGQEIHKVSLDDSVVDISTKEWAKGLYIFLIKDENTGISFTSKIIKR